MTLGEKKALQQALPHSLKNCLKDHFSQPMLNLFKSINKETFHFSESLWIMDLQLLNLLLQLDKNS